MKNIPGKILILIVIACWLGALQSCSSEKQSYKEFIIYLNNPENGLLKSKKANGYVLTAKILPEDYLVYNELMSVKNPGKIEIDSIREFYNNSMSVLFSIKVEDEKSENRTVFDGVNSIADYKTRIHKFNFRLENNFQLEAKGKTYTPLLATMENGYELQKETKFIVVFPKVENGESVVLKFKDDFFNTGTTWYTFDLNKINNVPELIF